MPMPGSCEAGEDVPSRHISKKGCDFHATDSWNVRVKVDEMPKCDPRIPKLLMSRSLMTTVFLKAVVSFHRPFCWPLGSLWYTWWLHPRFDSTLRTSHSLGFLLVSLTPVSQCPILDVSSFSQHLNVAVSRTQPTDLLLYLSPVPGDLMALKPSLGSCLQNLYLQPDLSPKLQTHISACCLDIPMGTS